MSRNPLPYWRLRLVLDPALRLLAEQYERGGRDKSEAAWRIREFAPRTRGPAGQPTTARSSSDSGHDSRDGP